MHNKLSGQYCQSNKRPESDKEIEIYPPT